ncbi:hypothetical protein COO60DRAFT_1059280 [Scenedesmus sp. NREL 46B-D3]|nr:hypothetical protein COO60DRAFT_1059280 [Scenedesmus sp. NREL 46B-D3]
MQAISVLVTTYLLACIRSIEHHAVSKKDLRSTSRAESELNGTTLRCAVLLSCLPCALNAVQAAHRVHTKLGARTGAWLEPPYCSRS